MNLEILSKDDIQVVVNRMELLDQKFDLILDLLSNQKDRFVDVPEICQRLGISDNSFYKLAVDNRLPFLVKLGGRWKAREKDLNNFLSTNNKYNEEKRHNLG